MYCSKCGAYIPEGETVCVACGTDSSMFQVNSGTAQASAVASAPASDEYRQTLEQKQREQQQKSKEWAEQAYADYKEQRAHSTSANTGGQPSSVKRTDGTVSPSTSKLLAGLSYVSILCFLPFVLAPKDDFSKFHGKQGILLFALSVIIDILSKFSGLLGLVLSLFRIYLIYKGVRNVMEGKKDYLPFIGQYAEKF